MKQIRIEDAELGLKQCGGPCQERLPLEMFDKGKDWCKTCRAKQRQVKLEAATEESLKELFDRMDAGVLLKLSGVVIDESTNIPHQVQGLEEVMRLMGGIQGFAAFYTAHVLATPPGSQQRQRALDKLWQLIMQCSDDGKVSKPREQMSDEELERIVNERVIRIAKDTVGADVRESA